MGRHWKPQIFGYWSSSPMLVGSMSFLVDFGSPNSTVVQNPGRLLSPPSVSNLKTGSSCVRYNPALSDNVAEFVSPNSSVIQNTGTMETTLSLSNLQSRSSQLKSKGTKSWSAQDENDIMSVQFSQNRKVLSDITNMSNSRVQCSINFPRMCDSNNDMLGTDRGIKKRVPFSTQNIDELYSIFSDGSLLKKRKSNMFEVPIIDLGYTPASDSTFSGRGNKKRKQIRLDNEVDIEFGAVNVQLSQNSNVLSDITNISHSHGQSSIGYNQIDDSHGNSDMIRKEVGANTYVSFSAQNNDCHFSMGSLSKKRKSNLFDVPISVMDDTSGADFANSERGKSKEKQRRLEHEVDIQFVPHITYLGDNGVTCRSSNRKGKRKETDSSRRPSARIGTARVPSTPRRKRVPKRVQGGGPVNINQHEALVLTENQIRARGLFEIQKQLSRSGKTLSDFPNMPIPDCDPASCIPNTLIAEQLDFNVDVLRDEFTTLHESMTAEQKSVFDQIIEAVQYKRGMFN
ncbi:hypothetical protein RIF29_27874 [Crotalaria pallida]|uniref:Uncharacterized protein n=1 Tax=Crotalaria pallida TaxID=3830 RepID=A0AAN9ES24_CROPI